MFFYNCQSTGKQNIIINTYLSVDCKSSLQVFYVIAYLTLTFDPVTLTLCQIKCLIKIYHMCQYHQDPTICSWFIEEKVWVWRINWPTDRPTDRSFSRVALFQRCDWKTEPKLTAIKPLLPVQIIWFLLSALSIPRMTQTTKMKSIGWIFFF